VDGAIARAAGKDQVPHLSIAIELTGRPHPVCERIGRSAIGIHSRAQHHRDIGGPTIIGHPE